MSSRFVYTEEDFDSLEFTNKVAKYSPDQPRDESGRFGFNNADMSASQTALRENGKISVSPKDALKLVREIGSYEIANGERNTPIDLNQIHIKGTDLFDSKNLGIPRSEMPQVPEKLRPEFEQYLKNNDISFKSEMVDPTTLTPSQSQLSLNGSFLKIGEILTGTPVADIVISKDNYVLDGHHRWAGAVLAGIEDPSVQLNVMRLDVDHNEALQTMYDFSREYFVASQGYGVFNKYSPDQERDSNGRFTTQVSGDPSDLNVGIQEFDPENAPVALPAWANQNTRIDWREPHIGLSDKAREVASRISPSSNEKSVEDRNRKGVLIESSKSSTAVYTAPDGKEWELKFSMWRTTGATGIIQGKVEVPSRLDSTWRVGSLNFGNRELNSSFAQITKVSVDAQYQRQGLATAMLEFARREASDVAIVHSTNLTNAGGYFSQVTKYAPNALYHNADGSCIVFDFLDGNNIYGRIVENGVESEPQELDTILAEGDWTPIYPEDDVVKSLMQDLEKFSADQPRDANGRFSFVEEGSGGGGDSTPKNFVTVNDKNISKKLMDDSIDKLTVSQIAGDPIPITDLYKTGTNITVAEMGQIAITGLLTRRENLDPDAVKYADEQLKGMLENSTPSVQMTSSALEEILNQERFLTLEELGSTVSIFSTDNGNNAEDWYRGTRLMAENLWFNYDNNTNAGERPVYGYMRSNDASKGVDTAMKAYGDIRVELKSDVLDRTTISIGDSLNNCDVATPFQYGSSLASTGFPQYNAIEANNYYDDGNNGNYFSSQEFFDQHKYVEAQFHGGIDTADIAKVYLPSKDPELQGRLDDAGIPWKVGRK